ncbi:hypothetical protein [Allonocardiopsis opalescens]|uniref:TLP18.3/Psb32/MOLO-1 phosphatase superfamily protein n=1 Tax=Allonocardiopsis opalescens TaxID=1144618 RepID=A0A2T0PSN0_9ACTN|nr:hypothetical protein [Allonocardiopsis opalescens]PRX91818.1 hypothetical protein CLV72_1133 [Allonocardiopsis opalescens]
MTPRARARWAALGAALAVAPLCAAALPAHEDPAPADIVAETARVERVAAGLADSPLFVDPVAAHLLTEEERDELSGRLAELPVPVAVVVMPSLLEDETGGDPHDFLFALRAQRGTDGLYLLVDPDGSASISHLAYEVPLDLSIPAGYDDGRRLAPQLAEVIDGIAAAPAAEPQSPRWFPDEPGTETGSETSDDFWGGLAVVGPLLGGTGYGLALLGRAGLRRAAYRRGPLRAARTGPAVSAGYRVPAHLAGGALQPVVPTARALRRLAESEVARLVDALRSAGADPGADRARADYDAAALLLETPPDRTPPSNVVGAVVLARDGQYALLRQGQGMPPGSCAVNPLHLFPESDARPVRLRRGRERETVCAACAQAGPAGRNRRGLALPPAPSGLDAEANAAAHRFWTEQRFGRRLSGLADLTLRHLGVE